MTDREFLMWIHERLEHVHGESPLTDYMYRLRAIIRVIPENKSTENTPFCCNSIDDLRKALFIKAK